eukprot:GHVN01047997.1.p1 GENE.GHVN01047997.1~~GHVN01047997.1.p1  ORF type:complete len:119 (+),score=21.47 GHVN01047997.1:241-597(+)
MKEMMDDLDRLIKENQEFGKETKCCQDDLISLLHNAEEEMSEAHRNMIDRANELLAVFEKQRIADLLNQDIGSSNQATNSESAGIVVPEKGSTLGQEFYEKRKRFHYLRELEQAAKES